MKMNFSRALEVLKNDEIVSREAWREQNHYIFITPLAKFQVDNSTLFGRFAAGTEVTYEPHIDISKSPGSAEQWSPTHKDLLANDWYIVELDMNDLNAA